MSWEPVGIRLGFHTIRFHIGRENPVISHIFLAQPTKQPNHCSTGLGPLSPFQILQVERLLHIEQISFLAQLQNLSRFWIIKIRNKSTLNLVWILKGFKPSDKNLINPPKFNLHMTFKNMNLDWLTCIQEFRVPLQMINMTLFIKTKPIDLNSKNKTKVEDSRCYIWCLKWSRRYCEWSQWDV
jgi:hypothetical protein